MPPVALSAVSDLRAIKPGEMVFYGLGSLLQASGSEGHDVPAARALSNILQSEWPDHGLPSHTSWWIPTRAHARRLFGRGLSVSGGASAGGDLAAQGAVMALASATRPALVLQRAGCQVHEVSNTVDVLIPEWDPTSGSGYWVNEGQAVGAASLLLRSGTATPHTVGVREKVSRRAALQAINIEAQLLTELARVIAVTIETGVWQGEGENGQPIGILSTPDAQSVAFDAPLPSYAELAEMLEAYLDKNGDPAAMTFFLHPKDFAKLLTTETSTGSGLFAATAAPSRQNALLGIPAYLSSALPEGTVVLCDPKDIHLVYWRSPSLNIDRTSLTGEVAYTVFNDLDVVVAHRQTLVIGSN